MMPTTRRESRLCILHQSSFLTQFTTEKYTKLATMVLLKWNSHSKVAFSTVAFNILHYVQSLPLSGFPQWNSPPLSHIPCPWSLGCIELLFVHSPILYSIMQVESNVLWVCFFYLGCSWHSLSNTRFLLHVWAFLLVHTAYFIFAGQTSTVSLFGFSTQGFSV